MSQIELFVTKLEGNSVSMVGGVYLKTFEANLAVEALLEVLFHGINCYSVMRSFWTRNRRHNIQ
jgi:hypothetical protein